MSKKVAYENMATEYDKRAHGILAK